MENSGAVNQIHKQFISLQDAVAQQLQVMAQSSNQSSVQLRPALNDRLAAIQVPFSSHFFPTSHVL
jgi:hypothetical protein